MPLRLPAAPHSATDPDPARRWRWLALLTGVLALLLAGWGVVQYAVPGPEPTPSGPPLAEEGPAPTANYPVRY